MNTIPITLMINKKSENNKYDTDNVNNNHKGVFKGGGVQGVQPSPPEIFRFFLKSELKVIERK